MEILSALPTIDCSANPNYPATNTIGYRVSVAGKIGGASGPNVYVNDILKPVAVAVAGTHAAVGASWTIIHNHQDAMAVESLDLSSATYSIPWGVSRVTAQQDLASTTTLTNATGLVQTGLLAGKTYKIEVELFVTATANNGFKCAFATPDTLTATAFRAIGNSYAAGVLVKNSAITTWTDAMLGDTSVIDNVKISGFITVNAAGSLRLQWAQNASHADTASLLVGSTMIVTQLQV